MVVLAVSMTLYLVVGLFFAPRGGNDAAEQVDKESVVVSVADGKVQLLSILQAVQPSFPFAKKRNLKTLSKKQIK